MCEWYSRGLATEEECRAALAACLAKGWLQVIDEPALTQITDELHQSGFIGPIYGLPPVGGVDFTHAGAELWHTRCGRQQRTRPPFAFGDVVHSNTTWYFRTRAAALREIDEAREANRDVTIIGPSATGPWRTQWWRWFPEGYRIDIEERMQWQGRAGGGGACFVMCRARHKSNPQRLQHVLNCHNVTLAEWLLFAAMEGEKRNRTVSSLPRSAAGSVAKQFGVTTSEDDCRTGLQACLRNGWLRAVDQRGRCGAGTPAGRPDLPAGPRSGGEQEGRD